MGKKKRVAHLTAQARAYGAWLAEIADGIDRLAVLRARQLGKLRQDAALTQVWYDDLDAAIKAGDEDQLRAAIAPYVRADHLRRLWDTYSDAGPEPGDLADLTDGEDLGDLSFGVAEL